ncbi:MAG TPA: hypothetical protein VG536_15145, partial [Pseudomonas sp.]|nr:hypothetical protein [Pseudomonas sp.]
YAEGAAHRPLQAPPLSLLKSQFAASELAWMKIKINTLRWDFPAMRCNWQVNIAGQARSHRETS